MAADDFWTGAALGLLAFLLILIIGAEIAKFFDSDTF